MHNSSLSVFYPFVSCLCSPSSFLIVILTLSGSRFDQYQDDRKGAKTGSHDNPERGFKTLALSKIMTDASTDNGYAYQEHREAHLLFPLCLGPVNDAGIMASTL